MPKYLKYFSGIIVALILVLIIIPFFIPLSHYKGIIQSEFKKATGLDIIIEGNLNLSIIPQPSIKLEKIKIPSQFKTKSPYLLYLNSATIKLSLSKLFIGKIAISYVELDQPTINLEMLSDGNVNWKLPNNKNSNAGVSHSTVINYNIMNLPIPLDRVTIKNGQFNYLKENNLTKLEKLNLNLQFNSTTEPINFSCNFNSQEQNFDLNGTIQQLENNINLTTEINALEQKINLTKNLNLDKIAFNGNMTLQGSLKNLLNTSNPQKDTSKNYKVEAKINANKSEANINSIILTLGNAKGNGELNYNIKNNQGNLYLKINPGAVKINFITKKATSNALESSINLQAQNISLLLNALGFNFPKLPNIINQDLSFNSKINYAEQKLTFDDFIFKSENSILRGVIGIQNPGDNSRYSYDIKTDNGSILANLLSINLPFNISNFRIIGNSIIAGKNIKTNTQIFADTLKSNITGNISLDHGIKPSLQIDILGDNLTQSIMHLFKVNLPKLYNFKLSTLINGDFNQKIDITLNKSTAKIGKDNVILKGNSTITLNTKKPLLSANLAISELNLNNLILKSNTNPSKKLEGGISNHWSTKKIDLSSFAAVDGKFALNIEKLTYGSLIFDKINTKTQLENAKLKFNSFNAHLYGGQLQGSGFISSLMDRQVDINMTLKNAHLKNILPENNKFKITQGLLNLTTYLNTKGKSQSQYINNITGNINFDVTDGKVSGVDLQKVLNTLTQVKNLEGALDLLYSSFSGGETAFQNLTGKLLFQKGIADLQDCRLIAQKANATATGKINLPDYYADITTKIDVAIPKIPAFKVIIYGNLDNPSHKLDTKALKKHLMQNLAINIIGNLTNVKDKPEDFIKDIFGSITN